ncbi:acyl-CoA dehydrogenase family protein [Arthrobacter sp. Soil736]|uniref:acyl-CoA dehydrogenase family protein n=1 Tax=Arthrobacter sp. Soil736 TaxID=1736395 RepID=UPI000A8EF569|nr:acyl-CoA dehydrogenase family protein [Arthrobacter sp. Soil736]
MRGAGSDRCPATLAQLTASATATEVADTGMRVKAGWGMARTLPMQGFFRDARLYTFAPPTHEMTRNCLGEEWLGLPHSY